jgi:hypothetical protein
VAAITVQGDLFAMMQEKAEKILARKRRSPHRKSRLLTTGGEGEVARRTRQPAAHVS